MEKRYFQWDLPAPLPLPPVDRARTNTPNDWLTDTLTDTHTTHAPAHTPRGPCFPFCRNLSTRNSLNQIQNTGRFELPLQDKPNKTQDSNMGGQHTPDDCCRRDDVLYRPEKSEDSGSTFLSFLALMATSAMRCMWSEGKWYVGKPGTRFRYSMSGGPSRETTSSELLEYQM